ncbi:MAG: hypothetical protein BAJATHORv1_130012 [Candidatus Thorarchaeota archaeon]|nr:MAG: hypothetical protein BAJATHORv1_130012 [Candidatus Thorarchaeota archaeon]
MTHFQYPRGIESVLKTKVARDLESIEVLPLDSIQGHPRTYNRGPFFFFWFC